MFGLVVFAIVIGYLAIAIGVSVAAFRAAQTKGASRTKQVATGSTVGLVFFLIPFWDWIPTVVAHRYYCATEATFEVYKTVEQWKTENADILRTLHYDPRASITQVGEYRRFPLNQRVVTERRTVERFLSIELGEGRLVDMKTGEILARFADFRSGPKASSVVWKSWLQESACVAIETGRSPNSLYASLENEYEFGKSRQYNYGGER